MFPTDRAASMCEASVDHLPGAWFVFGSLESVCIMPGKMHSDFCAAAVSEVGPNRVKYLFRSCDFNGVMAPDFETFESLARSAMHTFTNV